MSQPEDQVDYGAAIEANDDLLERLRHGDVWALPSLLEAVTGIRVSSMRILDRQHT